MAKRRVKTVKKRAAKRTSRHGRSKSKHDKKNKIRKIIAWLKGRKGKKKVALSLHKV